MGSQVLSLAQRREQQASLEQSGPAGGDAGDGTGGASTPAASAAAAGGAGGAAAPALATRLTAIKPTGTRRRTLAVVNADSPTYTGALGVPV